VGNFYLGRSGTDNDVKRDPNKSKEFCGSTERILQWNSQKQTSGDRPHCNSQIFTDSVFCPNERRNKFGEGSYTSTQKKSYEVGC
jgi:hypothetical protein